jgi:hypothetical protein
MGLEGYVPPSRNGLFGSHRSTGKTRGQKRWLWPERPDRRPGQKGVRRRVRGRVRPTPPHARRAGPGGRRRRRFATREERSGEGWVAQEARRREEQEPREETRGVTSSFTGKQRADSVWWRALWSASRRSGSTGRNKRAVTTGQKRHVVGQDRKAKSSKVWWWCD